MVGLLTVALLLVALPAATASHNFDEGAADTAWGRYEAGPSTSFFCVPPTTPTTCHGGFFGFNGSGAGGAASVDVTVDDDSLGSGASVEAFVSITADLLGGTWSRGEFVCLTTDELSWVGGPPGAQGTNTFDTPSGATVTSVSVDLSTHGGADVDTTVVQFTNPCGVDHFPGGLPPSGTPSADTHTNDLATAGFWQIVI